MARGVRLTAEEIEGKHQKRLEQSRVRYRLRREKQGMPLRIMRTPEERKEAKRQWNRDYRRIKKEIEEAQKPINTTLCLHPHAPR